MYPLMTGTEELTTQESVHQSINKETILDKRRHDVDTQSVIMEELRKHYVVLF